MFNGFDLSTIQDANFGNSQISSIYYGANLIWPTTPQHDYSQDYLTIVSLANNNNIIWTASDASIAKTISVSTDGGSTWTNYTSSTAGTTLATLNNGDELLIKGNNTVYNEGQSYYNSFSTSGNYNIEGNIMSLIYEDNFINQTSFPNNSSNNFTGLFLNSDTLISAENLILPATTLVTSCYNGMFMYCDSLTTAPKLPATSLADYCYVDMFNGCRSLTAAPKLPATSLATSCYQSMFFNCRSLSTAPELPATTLATYCYHEMFEYCRSLSTAPELPATTLATRCYKGMFNNCNSLTAAPELQATTLAMECYSSMFHGCTSLNYIKCLATDISALDCTYGWVSDVAATGTFVKDANTTWPSGTSGIPSGWTVQNA